MINLSMQAWPSEPNRAETELIMMPRFLYPPDPDGVTQMVMVRCNSKPDPDGLRQDYQT